MMVSLRGEYRHWTLLALLATTSRLWTWSGPCSCNVSLTCEGHGPQDLSSAACRIGLRNVIFQRLSILLTYRRTSYSGRLLHVPVFRTRVTSTTWLSALMLRIRKVSGSILG